MDFHFARLTAFMANIVRDDHKHPDPYVYTDFLVEWNEIWDAVANPLDPELTEEEEQMRTESLLGKATAITAMFGGSPQ